MGVTTSVYVKESRVCVKERYQFIEEHYHFFVWKRRRFLMQTLLQQTICICMNRYLCIVK